MGGEPLQDGWPKTLRLSTERTTNEGGGEVGHYSTEGKKINGKKKKRRGEEGGQATASTRPIASTVAA